MRTHRLARFVGILLFLAAFIVLVSGILGAIAIDRGSGFAWASGWHGWLVILFLLSALGSAIMLLLFGALLFFLARIDMNLSRTLHARKQATTAVTPAAPTVAAPGVEPSAPAILVPSAVSEADQASGVIEPEPTTDVAAQTPAVELPEAASLEAQLPDIQLPAVDAPAVELPEAASLEAQLPDIQLPAVDAPAVELPEAASLEAQLPDIQLPAVELPEAASLEAQLPDIELPAVDAPAVELPEAASLEAQLPDIQLPAVELPEAASLEAQLPDIQLPAVELPEAASLEAQLPDILLPAVDAPAVELPAVRSALESGIKLDLAGELSEADLAGIDVPELTPTRVTLPQVELPSSEWSEAPAVRVEPPAIETVLPTTAVSGVGAAAPAEVDTLRAQLAALQARLAQIETAPLAAEARVAASLPQVEIEYLPAATLEAEIAQPSGAARLPGADEAARIAAEMAAITPRRRVIAEPAEVQADVDAAPATGEDDLEIINGIGPAYSRRLRKAGITTFSALAETADELLSQAAGTFAERVRREDWRGQARKLSEK